MAKIPLSLTATLASTVVPVTGQPRLVYLLVDVSGGEGAEALPSNLGFILDTSESMRIRLVSDEQFKELARSGQAQEVMTDGVPAYQIKSVSNDLIARFPRRIDYVSEALVVASEYLRTVDCFSVVAFAGRAHCMIPSTPGKERARLHQAARELEYMKLGDDTQMAEGLAMAFKEVQQLSNKEFASRLILLTDGHTRKVKECYDWAAQARKAGIKLTTMGIGVEFNEDLLIPLADKTGGNAYYVETPDQLPEIFRRELGAALRISYRNVEVKLQLSAGVGLRRVYRVLPELSAFDQGPNMQDSYALLLGDYDPAAAQALLVELIVPPWPAGTFRLAQALLAWDDPEGGLARQSQRKDIVVHVSSLATAPFDDRVMNIIEKVGAFKMGTQALEAAQNAAKSTSQDDKNSATVRLRQAATRLIDMGETALADAMLHQADTLERSGSLDPEAAKKLRYETRRLTQRL
jgi:hypothetical protein